MIEPVTIGDALLFNADCLEILPTLGKVDAVVTDPPYGTTQCSWDSIIPLDSMWKGILNCAKENAPIIFTSCQPFTTILISSKLDLFRYELIWEKTKSTGFLDCAYRPMRSHENILLFYRSKPTYNPQKTKGDPWNRGRVKRPKSVYGEQKENYSDNPSGLREPTSVITVANPNNHSFHPTEKPVVLMEWLIKTYSNDGDTVLDFAMGSGTTGVAALKLGRKFIGIEIDPTYFKIACDRIAKEANQLKLFQGAVV